MKLDILVHYQMGNSLQQGRWPCDLYIQIYAYMTIIVRSMYNFVNCLQFNIRYEKVERPALMGGALVILFELWLDYPLIKLSRKYSQC
jgi:hypothetical protein